MSMQRTVTLICDRCKKVARTGNGDEDDWPDNGDAPALEIKAHGTIVLTFDDLCEKCQTRVDALVGKFTLKADKDDKQLELA
jgi:hypothetical protein